MIRRTFTAAVAISLAVFVGSVVAYVVSHAHPMQVVFVRSGYCWDLNLTGGGAGFGCYDGWTHDEPAIGSTQAKHPIERINLDYDQHAMLLGAVTTGTAVVMDNANMNADPWGNTVHPSRFLMVGIRLENVALLALVLPAVWLGLRYWRQKLQRASGFPVKIGA